MREKTTYIIDVVNEEITTKGKIRKEFVRNDDDFRWWHGNSSENYIYELENDGKLIVIEENGHIMSDKIFTPKQYGKLVEISIPSDISLEKFDEITSEHNLWNYPLSEYSHIVENDLKVVVVKFNNYDYRFVEIKND